MKEGGTLCVDDETLHIRDDQHFLSLKEIFSKIIDDPKFNSSYQQDASEALSRVLSGLQHQELNQDICTTGFWFCRYKSRYRYTCRLCRQENFSQPLPENILRVPVPQREDVSLTFDMKAAVRSTLEDEHEHVKTCNKLMLLMCSKYINCSA